MQHVWSRIGSAEIATDPMGVELTDVFVTLKTRDQWKTARSQAELTGQLERLVREFPGQKAAFSQPIELRINEMISGARADLAVKLFGDDLNVLKDKALEIEKVLKSIEGNADVSRKIDGAAGTASRINQERRALRRARAAVLDRSNPRQQTAGRNRRPVQPLVVPAGSFRNIQAIGAMLPNAGRERYPVSRLATVESSRDHPRPAEWGQRV